MSLDLKQLKKDLEQKVKPEFRAYLLQEVPKGEALLEQAGQEDPFGKAVLGPLSKMYLVLNQQLGLVCKALGYPLEQWKWQDSLPLETLAQVYEGLEATQWFQRHLQTMLMPQDPQHPWTKITT